MKTKTMLILSLGANVVMLLALGYLHSLPAEPRATPPIVFLIDRTNPDSVATAFRAAVGETEAR